MSRVEPADVLQEQLDYYRARAAEYDEWWLREGRYDRGLAHRAQWFREAYEVRLALAEFRPRGKILELASGTGIWTEQLLPFARRLTALDASPEMLAINAGRVNSPLVRYLQADLFRWRPASDERYDTVFFGFWLSHVPPERFDDFWELVRSCLAPQGRVFFVDSLRQETSTASDHVLPASGTNVLQRRLNDGREFRVYKIFYQPVELAARLQILGWNFELKQTDNFFIYGSGSRAVPAAE